MLVVFGSVSTSFFFARFFNADLGPAFYWLLASTVWVIYTMDHVIDGIQSAKSNQSLRHALHYRYRATLITLCSIIVPCNVYLAFRFLSPNLIIAGMLIACFVFLYLLLIPMLKRLKKWPIKEVLVAIGVSAGMCLLPGLAGKIDWHYSYILLVLAFTLINFLNLLIFSILDEEQDRVTSMPSIVQSLGNAKSKDMANSLVVLTFFVMGFWLYSYHGIEKRYVIVVLMLMLNVLALILLKREYFSRHDLFRFWGDSIYLIPGLVQALFVEKLI